MHRVVINRFTTAGAKTGIGHYTSELIQHLTPHQDSDFQLGLFPQGPLWWAANYLGPLQRMMTSSNETRSASSIATSQKTSALRGLPTHAFRALARVAYARVAKNVANYMSSRNFDLYHEPNYIPFHYERSLECDLPTVVTVHDLSVLLYPHWHPENRVMKFESHFGRVLSDSSHFIADCEHVRQQMIDLLHVDPDNVTTVYPAIRTCFQPLSTNAVDAVLARLKLERGFFLHVGSIEPRKNLETALRAYCALPDNIRERHPFLLVGPWGWGWKDVRRYFDDVARHKGVIHAGYVDERDLPALFNGALALVYPSHYEGFGMPPLEMKACGGAVLASDIPTLRETLRDGAQFVDPRDEVAWRDTMARAAEDREWMTGLRTRGAHDCARFTWNNTAADTLAVYKQVLAATRHAATRDSMKAA